MKLNFNFNPHFTERDVYVSILFLLQNVWISKGYISSTDEMLYYLLFITLDSFRVIICIILGLKKCTYLLRVIGKGTIFNVVFNNALLLLHLKHVNHS
jgi:hypothetical protein